MTEVDPHHLRLVEAILFAAAEPMTKGEIAARLPDGADVDALLATLQAAYAGRGVNLIPAGATWAFSTAADLAPWLRRDVQVEKKLSRAAIETLAIIAYHQPVTRADIEDARGVQVGRGTLDALLAQGWVRPGGRREAPGRPVEWVTTDDFLRHFVLTSLGDLPRLEELKAAGLLDNGTMLQTYSEGAPGLHDAHDGPRDVVSD
ncbi:MAG: SMC-Scp complex subunit ScpB [Rhodospirillales bacterium]